jgi:hypothetical protein
MEGGPSSAARAASAGSDRSERRVRKAQEVEQRNERSMLDACCKLLVSKGMTSRPGTDAAAAATAAGSAPPPLAAMDPKLCERISERLASMLKVPVANARAALLHAHNLAAGLPAP